MEQLRMRIVRAAAGVRAARPQHTRLAHLAAPRGRQPPPPRRLENTLAAAAAAGTKGDVADAPPSDDAPPSPKAVVKRQRMDLGQRIELVSIEDSGPIDAGEWDFVFDVRSPGEFDEDHVPGATSAPVMSNEERATVGTIYKQESPFHAKRLGAAIVSKNIAEILMTHCQDLPKEGRVLVYCWRGGERSCSLAHTLSRVGFDTSLVVGGYKSYRKSVLNFMDGLDSFEYHIIGGRTGSAKGRLLEQLIAHGAQVLDLEGCANHRGSILGDEPDAGQPSQKLFESRIHDTMKGFSRDRVVFVEGESSRVGVRNVPGALWGKMQKSPSTELVLPMDERVAYTRAEYRHFETTHVDVLREKINRLRSHNGHQTIDRWLGWCDEGRWDEFVRDMLEVHYDPRYDAARKRDRSAGLSDVVELPDMQDPTYAAAARALIDSVPNA